VGALLASYPDFGGGKAALAGGKGESYESPASRLG